MTQGSYVHMAHTTDQEVGKLIGLLLYMSVVRVGDFDKMYSAESLCNGLWARAFIPSVQRAEGLLRFLQVTDRPNQDPADKLRSIRQLYNHVRARCATLYQPTQQLSIDERMVKCKGRFSFRQFLPSKPIRFGYKVFVLADSSNGYTVDFNVYLGKENNDGNPQDHTPASEAIVQRLMEPYLRQGYHLFIDNYYTLLPLLNHLYVDGTRCVGTMRSNRGPAELRSAKAWAKRVARGDMRYVRVNEVAVIQWKDKKPVTLASTLHRATDQTACSRNTRGADGDHMETQISRPTAFRDYNQHMGGVDVGDQILATNDLHRRSRRYWKALFYHLVNLCVIQAFILFRLYRQLHPGEIPRTAKYNASDFRLAVARQLAGIAKHAEPPAAPKRRRKAVVQRFSHMPVKGTRGNCRFCAKVRGDQSTKTNIVCTHCKGPLGQPVHLCLNGTRNCFLAYHSGEADAFCL